MNRLFPWLIVKGKLGQLIFGMKLYFCLIEVDFAINVGNICTLALYVHFTTIVNFVQIFSEVKLAC